MPILFYCLCNISSNIITDEQVEDGTTKLSLEEFGIDVFIPPGAQVGDQKISVEPIFNMPPDVHLASDEALITFGLKFAPSGETFTSPVKVTIAAFRIFITTSRTSQSSTLHTKKWYGKLLMCKSRGLLQICYFELFMVYNKYIFLFEKADMDKKLSSTSKLF